MSKRVFRDAFQAAQPDRPDGPPTFYNGLAAALKATYNHDQAMSNVRGARSDHGDSSDEDEENDGDDNYPITYLKNGAPILPQDPPSEKPKEKKKRPRTCHSTMEHACLHQACGKSFTRRSDLVRHMRAHSGERPFACTVEGCDKRFIQSSALRVHERTHSGERPHKCEYPDCASTFADSSALARHRRTHTGHRPYKCTAPFCEKAFTRRSTLITHMKMHDPNWQPDPQTSKKGGRSLDGDEHSDDDDQEDGETSATLENSIHNIAAIINEAKNNLEPGTDPFMAISEKIAAAMIQPAVPALGPPPPGSESAVAPPSNTDRTRFQPSQIMSAKAGKSSKLPRGTGSIRETSDGLRLVAATFTETDERDDLVESEDDDDLQIPLRTRRQ